MPQAVATNGKRESQALRTTNSARRIETHKKVGPKPRSLAITETGIRNVSDINNLMSWLICDLLDGRINPPVVNASCNATGKMLKAVEMQFKYGTPRPGKEKILALSTGAAE